MIIEGNITIGSSVTIASNAVPYGDAVFFANTVGLLGYDITNGPRYTYTANATYKWVVPSGVTSISVLCIGGGGAGGGGGATSSLASRITAPNMVSTDGRYWSGSGGGGGGLVYANNIPVTPGTEYIIQVGGGGQKGWQAYDPTDLDFGSVANNLGRPTAFSGGPSFFTTNAAIIAKQTAMVIASGGAAGKANINCINGTGSLSSAIYSLIGGGGGGAGGYKGAGGAGGNGVVVAQQLELKKLLGSVVALVVVPAGSRTLLLACLVISCHLVARTQQLTVVVVPGDLQKLYQVKDT